MRRLYPSDCVDSCTATFQYTTGAFANQTSVQAKPNTAQSTHAIDSLVIEYIDLAFGPAVGLQVIAQLVQPAR